MLIVIPMAPIGKGRPRMAKNGHVYTPKATRQWEKEARVHITKQFVGDVLTGPVRVQITAIMPRPKMYNQYLKSKGEYKYPEGRMWHAKKPDIDNIAKIVLDSLDDVLRDDCQVVELRVRKEIAAIDEEPRVRVFIFSVDGEGGYILGGDLSKDVILKCTPLPHGYRAGMSDPDGLPDGDIRRCGYCRGDGVAPDFSNNEED